MYKNSGELPKKLSRARFLRDSVITASGVAFLPSLLSSCKKDVVTPDPGNGGGLGGTETATKADLEKAAGNLTRIREWISDLYPLTIEYEMAVFELLESTKNEAPGWSDFIGKLFIDIAASIADALGGGAAFGLLFDVLKDWGDGNNTPPDLAGTFGEFEIGHNRMQFAMEQKLSHLVDPTDNYSNLRNHKFPIVIENGNNTSTSYTFQQLVDEDFPGLGDAYNKLQSDAYTQFKKSIWNLVVMKTCTLVRYEDDYKPNSENTQTITEWARQKYADNPGIHIRGRWYWDFINNHAIAFSCWDLGLNGKVFPPKAAAVLFMDDTPGHIINPEGLFVRSYVFEQFALTKPDLLKWGDRISATNPNAFVDPPGTPDGGIENSPNDWNFTGGIFLRLAKITP